MTDNEKLLELQAKIKNGDNAALSVMYKKLYEIAYKTINNRSRKNEIIAGMTAAERQQKAHDAVTYIIEQYLKRPDFEITESVTGYLYRRVCYELYGRMNRACDKMLIYTDFSKTPQTKTKTRYRYIVKDTASGKTETYESAAELYLNPAFEKLRKKQLAECIKTGCTWKHYIFDLLEVNE